MFDPQIVPVKETVPFTEYFGSLFDKHWKQFFEVHKPEFEEFLKANKITDQKLAKAGITRDDLAKQFCAVQMSYYLFRYSGLLNVRYVRVENREELREKMDATDGSPIKKEEVLGERFGLMLADILSGKDYKIPGALETFSTFGDCDETAFLIAQGIEALNQAHNLGMEISLVPIAHHTNVGVNFKGLRGEYRLDPTMFSGGIYAGMYPEDPISKEDREEITMNEGPEERKYREEVIPRLNRKVKVETRKVLVHRSETDRVEQAVATTSTNPLLNLNLASASMRLLMNEARRKPSTFKRFVQFFNRIHEASSEIVDIATRTIASFGKDYEGGLVRLREAQIGLDPAQSLELLRMVAGQMTKGKDIYAAINSSIEHKKLAMAG